MSTEINGRAGFTLAGEYLSTKKGKPWTSKQDGAERTPILVTVLVGDRSLQVEYRDTESADAAVGGAERGDPVILPVYPRAKGKDWLHVAGVNLRTGE